MSGNDITPLMRFYYSSQLLHRLLLALASLPAKPLPRGLFHKSNMASKNHWRVQNPNLSGNVLNERPIRDHLSHWFQLADAAYDAAGADDNLRADIVSLQFIMGPRDYILWESPGASDELRNAETLRAASLFARDPTGFGIREFERGLAAIRRHVTLQEVGSGNAHTPALNPLPLDEVDIDILRFLAQRANGSAKIKDIAASRERTVIGDRIRGRLIPRKFVERIGKEKSRSGVRITALGREQIPH